MRNLYQAEASAEIRERLARLSASNERQWGKMDVAQAMAHCGNALEGALGDVRPRRLFIGRLFGGMAKRAELGSDQPLRRNSPTSPELKISDARQLEMEKLRLLALIDRFVAGGPSACTTHPHSFFGPMTPEEWATLMYKHIDHHLRQFGA